MALSVRVFVIENDVMGIPRVTAQPDVTWSRVQEFLGQPSAGDLGVVFSADATIKGSVTLSVFTCEPRGIVAEHTGPRTSLCYVIHGQGKLTLKRGEPMDYQQHDCIIFKPETVHGWECGDEPTSMLIASIR